MYKLCCLLLFVLLGASALSQETSPTVDKDHNLLLESPVAKKVVPGSRIGSLTFRDITGMAHHIDQTSEETTVLVVVSSTCPLAKRYSGRLQQLHESLKNDRVRFISVFPNDDETVQGIREHADRAQWTFPAVRDVGAYISRKIGASMTPQAFVIDANGILRYRGAIDDHRYENRVKQRYLADAVNSVVKEESVTIKTTNSHGCTIHVNDDNSSGLITYSRHIARILNDNCLSCHRKGQVAPFALESYEDAKRWKTEIREYTRSRVMPPWKADAGFAHYENDISLSQNEIDLISTWVDQGAPLGSKEETPPAPRFSDDWAFGTPDMIVKMPSEYTIAPEGEDDYRHFVIPYEAIGDRFVEAIDVRPGNRNVVHHVLAYIDTSGKARELDAEDEGPGYTRFGDVGFEPVSVIGGWAPGSIPLKAPSGTGRWLPKKCDIVLQVHYYRTGLEERDQTKIAVYFSKARQPVRVRGGVVINQDFTVPAGHDNFPVKAEFEVKEPSYLFSVTPHMHLIGETMCVTAHRPDGSVVNVVKIDDWDFNWQTSYRFRQMQFLPAGTKVKLTATFDNTASNPNNPHTPPEDIGWGEKTTDEMCIAFLGMLHESEYDPTTSSRRPPSEKLLQVSK